MVKLGILEKNTKDIFYKKELLNKEDNSILNNEIIYPIDILKKYSDSLSWDQYSDFDNWSKWTAR